MPLFLEKNKLSLMGEKILKKEEEIQFEPRKESFAA